MCGRETEIREVIEVSDDKFKQWFLYSINLYPWSYLEMVQLWLSQLGIGIVDCCYYHLVSSE